MSTGSSPNPQPNPNPNTTISIGTVSGSQSATFQVTTVANINITHISIVEDKLRVILDRQVPLMHDTGDSTFTIIALIASAIFNVVSCLPPVLTSTFTDGYGIKAKDWTTIFNILALASIGWLIFIVMRSLIKAYLDSEKRKNVITVDKLIDIIKTVN